MDVDDNCSNRDARGFCVCAAPKTRTINLGYDTGKTHITESVRAMVFGELIRLVRPVLEAYESDLYHDALWLQTFANDMRSEITFYYSFNNSGTSIGVERTYLTREHKYRMTIRVHDGKSDLEIVDLTEES